MAKSSVQWELWKDSLKIDLKESLPILLWQLYALQPRFIWAIDKSPIIIMTIACSNDDAVDMSKNSYGYVFKMLWTGKLEVLHNMVSLW